MLVFYPYETMWAFIGLLLEVGPHKDRGKLWLGWELNPRPSGWITVAQPTGLQGQVMGIEDVKFTAMNIYKYKEGLRFWKRWPCNTYIRTDLIIRL